MLKYIKITNKLLMKRLENAFLFSCIFVGLSIFSYYVYRIIFPECSHLGYTLCAALGEDFYSLYQAGHNVFTGHYIYGSLAGNDLVTPYFMEFKYLPTTALVWGSFFRLITPNAECTYHLFLTLSIIAHLLGAFLIWLIWKKQKASKYILGIALLLWLGFFALNSEWRMGQFNDIAGVFFLGFLTGVIYEKKYLSPMLWTLSLSWKPLALFTTPFFLKIKYKIGLLFFLTFIFGTTFFYIVYFQLKDPTSITTFLNTILLGSNRDGWQIHYIDNFSVNSFIAEIFYDKSPIIYNLLSKAYLFLIIVFLGIVTLGVKLKTKGNEVLYLLFTATTFLVFHKEVWESLLTFWAPIVVVCFIISKEKWEKVLIGLCGFVLATPSLYYLWHFHKTYIMRFLLISEKALPQVIVYVYLLYKLMIIIKSEKYRGLSIAALVTGILAIGLAGFYLAFWFYASDLFIYVFLYGVSVLSIAAVVCGSIDLKRIKAGRHSSKGRGFDIAGIVLGGIFILFILVFLLSEVVAPLSH